MSKNFNQQRRFPRIPSENAVMVERLSGEWEGAFTKTNVVGLGGCSFTHGEPLGERSSLSLLISVHGRVITTKAHVVYENAKDDGTYLIGVEFEEISPLDRHVIEKLLEKEQAESLPDEG